MKFSRQSGGWWGAGVMGWLLFFSLPLRGAEISGQWIIDLPSYVAIEDPRSWPEVEGALKLPFRSAGRDRLPLGQSVWLKFDLVRGIGDSTERLWFRLPMPGVDSAEAYLFERGKFRTAAKAGYSVPRHERSAAGVALGLPLDRWVGERAEVFVRVVLAQRAEIAPRVMTERAFWRANNFGVGLMFLYAGAAVFAMLFQSVLWVAFDDRVSRAYVGFAASLLLLGAARSGFGDYLLGGLLGGFTLGANLEILRLVSSWLGLNSICEFFAFRARAPQLARSIRVYGWVLGVCGVVGFLLPPHQRYQAVAMAQAGAVALVGVSCTVALLRRLPAARWISIAWSPILIATALRIAEGGGVVALRELEPELVPVMAVLWELFFTTIGLGHRLRIMREEQHANSLRAVEAAGLARLLRVVVHDISSPLAVVSFTTDLMARALKEGTDYDYPRAVARLHHSVRVMREITETVRDWTLLRDAQGKLPTHPVDLSTVLDESLKVFEERLANKNITVVRDFGQFPIYIMGDDRVLRCSVFANALSNAIKFSPVGGEISVSVLVRCGHAEVRVRDHGLGMNAARVTELMERGSWVGSTRGTANEAGSGFGVALMRDFTRAMGGSFKIQSRGAPYRSTGTTVLFSFRLATHEDEAEKPAGIVTEGVA